MAKKKTFADAITGGVAGAGAAAPTMNPWVIGGAAIAGAVGNVMAGEAEEEDPAYRMGMDGMRIQNQMNRISLGQAQRQDRRMRKKEVQASEFGTLLGNMFRAAKGGFGDQVMRPPV